MNNERIAVIGAGTMGAGIAGQSALCGMATILFDIDAAGLENGLAHIQSSYNKGLERGKLDQSEINHAQKKSNNLLESRRCTHKRNNRH